MKWKVIGRGEIYYAVTICIGFLLFFVYYQSASVYGGDAGDLVTAAFVRGVAHPPGYPLYTFLGWLLTKLPVLTVAWRVTLLSSLPAAFTLTLLYLILRQLLVGRLTSFITILTLGFSYLYWLYASVPEVFMLHLLLVSLLLYFLIKLNQSQKILYAYGFFFIFGLSLTHHHTILFLVPGFLIILIPSTRLLLTKKNLIVSIGAFLLGLLPYLYVVWAARGSPVVNWENPQTFNGFFRLVTRAIYGSFRSHQGFDDLLANRYYQIKLALGTFVIDFTKLGVLLWFLGAYRLFKKQRLYFWSLLTNLVVTAVFFFFYAGFPSAINFHLATVERFLLTPYLFFAFFLAFGIEQLVSFIQMSMRKIVPYYVQLFQFLFLLLPMTLLITNYPKISSLRRDQTAENLGADILNTVPDNSLILLLDDTAVFDTQYVYFTQGGKSAWRGIKLVQAGILAYPNYQKSLMTLYPELIFPPKEDNIDLYIKNFIEKNQSQFSVFTLFKTPVDTDYLWVPHGLLFNLQKISEVIYPETFISGNNALFAKYHDPVSGALKIYEHLMLSDVRRIYVNAYREVGQSLFLLERYADAEAYFQKAVSLQNEVLMGQYGLVWSLLKQNKCPDVAALLPDLRRKYPNDLEFLKIAIVWETTCSKNEDKIRVLEKELESFSASAGTKLKGF